MWRKRESLSKAIRISPKQEKSVNVAFPSLIKTTLSRIKEKFPSSLPSPVKNSLWQLAWRKSQQRLYFRKLGPVMARTAWSRVNLPVLVERVRMAFLVRKVVAIKHWTAAQWCTQARGAPRCMAPMSSTSVLMCIKTCALFSVETAQPCPGVEWGLGASRPWQQRWRLCDSFCLLSFQPWGLKTPRGGVLGWKLQEPESLWEWDLWIHPPPNQSSTAKPVNNAVTARETIPVCVRFAFERTALVWTVLLPTCSQLVRVALCQTQLFWPSLTPDALTSCSTCCRRKLTRRSSHKWSCFSVSLILSQEIDPGKVHWCNSRFWGCRVSETSWQTEALISVAAARLSMLLHRFRLGRWSVCDHKDGNNSNDNDNNNEDGRVTHLVASLSARGPFHHSSSFKRISNQKRIKTFLLQLICASEEPETSFFRSLD